MSDMRDAFEKWFSDNHVEAGETVNLQMKADMWAGFQAALAQGDAEPEAFISHSSDGDILGCNKQFYVVEHTPLYTHPLPAQPEGDGWVKCHMETAAIALEALEFFARERFKGFGDDPEPYEHHLAQQAISELQELVPQPPKEGDQ